MTWLLVSAFILALATTWGLVRRPKPRPFPDDVYCEQCNAFLPGSPWIETSEGRHFCSARCEEAWR